MSYFLNQNNVLFTYNVLEIMHQICFLLFEFEAEQLAQCYGNFSKLVSSNG